MLRVALLGVALLAALITRITPARSAYHPSFAASAGASGMQGPGAFAARGTSAVFLLSGIAAAYEDFGLDDDGHVEMGGFLERLSAKIDGKDVDEPPPPTPPPTPRQHAREGGGGGGGGGGPPLPQPSAEVFAETFPGRQPVRINKINPDLTQKAAAATGSHGQTDRIINLVDSNGAEGRYRLKQDLPDGKFSITTEDGKRVDMSELQKSGSKLGGGGGGPAATSFAGSGPSDQQRIRKALAEFEAVQAQQGSEGGGDGGGERRGGRKKRGGRGKDRRDASEPPPRPAAAASGAAGGQYIGSGGYPPRPAVGGGSRGGAGGAAALPQRYASGGTKTPKMKVSTLDDAGWKSAPEAVHQWQDEGAKVYVLIQISGVDVERTVVDIRRDEVRVLAWTVADKLIRSHLVLRHPVVPKDSYWEFSGERGGIDLALRKADVSLPWLQLLRADIDPLALGESHHTTPQRSPLLHLLSPHRTRLPACLSVCLLSRL